MQGLSAERSGVGNLDRDEHLTVLLDTPEQDLLWKVAQRIERGDFELPQLPSTSLAAIEMSNRPSVEVRAVVELIANDPLLSSELLKAANSALYAGHASAETLHEAVMRVGLRTLRSMIFGVSMRGVILRSGGLADHAEEVWRQAHSVAGIARAIAPELGLDPERTFLLGLLHDIGKIALLDILRREVDSPGAVSPALVGRVFLQYHETAGAAMARAWRLPEELGSVAGCHHAFAANPGHARAAAAAVLAHRLDLHLSLGDAQGFAALASAPAMEFLGLPHERRARVLAIARATYAAAHAPP